MTIKEVQYMYTHHPRIWYTGGVAHFHGHIKENP